MKTNVGTVDRAARALLGLLLIAWALFDGPLWAWIGLIPLATALVGFCPLYRLLGFSSAPSRKLRSRSRRSSGRL
ncbi:DUF2892 domain-containing protein [Stagnimonas aquatica]|uniref:DUF2892 domain-containing protein n=1 Tax=Stagnimonas aquatica TaxID=2689987 RepID=A0A3N0VGA2_9GAMM|nr:DUF2892 domain-containing protein [Stagnimonas aquatica]ROH91776.1 DUF2892 domain-containing protein [Stagnimonas aquatica]